MPGKSFMINGWRNDWVNSKKNQDILHKTNYIPRISMKENYEISDWAYDFV